MTESTQTTSPADPATLARQQAIKTIRDCAGALAVPVRSEEEFVKYFEIIRADGLSLDNVNELLAGQAYTLNAAYNRVLQEGVAVGLFDPVTINAALKAQKQFCQTIQVLERLTRQRQHAAPDYNESEKSNETNA